MAEKPEDSHPDALSEPSAQEAQGHTSMLAACFGRGRAILKALVAGVPEGDSLIAATDQNGFPVAQRILPRPTDLPRALVIGRHNRCALAVPNDTRVSLRHLLLTAWPGEGPVRYRGYDLGGRAGVVLADGKRVPGFSFRGQGIVSFGRTTLFVVPGAGAGGSMLEGGDEDAFRRLTGLGPSGAGVRIALSTIAEPGVAQLDAEGPQEYGGYRGAGFGGRPQPRGVLRLRSTKPGKGGDEVRELDVNSEQLQRGLLIGRYSDRCSLAGQGRNLSRVHALVAEEGPHALLVYDLASTNGVRPEGLTEGPSHSVVRLTEETPIMLGHFELSWVAAPSVAIH